MKRNPWPFAIILYFVVFIGAMAAWIVFAVHHDHELVRKDYYEQEMNFQREIENSARAAALEGTISYDGAKQTVTVALPALSDGTIYFYRASQARLDREISINLKNGAQTIDVRDFERGLWKVRLSWNVNGVRYRHDESLVLVPSQLSSL